MKKLKSLLLSVLLTMVLFFATYGLSTIVSFLPDNIEEILKLLGIVAVLCYITKDFYDDLQNCEK